MLGEQIRHRLAKLRRHEVLLFQPGIVAVNECGDDGGIGRRPADAFFFQFAHQRGFGVARRRLGELLLFFELQKRQFLVLDQLGQGFGLIARFLAKNPLYPTCDVIQESLVDPG